MARWRFPSTSSTLPTRWGLSLVHTNKTMRRLQLLGLHEIRSGRLWRLNPRALQRLADCYDAPLRKAPLL